MKGASAREQSSAAVTGGCRELATAELWLLVSICCAHAAASCDFLHSESRRQRVRCRHERLHSLARPLQKTPRSPRGFSVAGFLSNSAQPLDLPAASARQRAKQWTRHTAGAPAPLSGGYLHADQCSGVVAFSDRFYPGNGISDRVIKAAVLRVELTVRLAATINQAVATLCSLAS